MPRVRKPACIEREEAITKMFKRELINKGWSMGHLAKVCGKNLSHVSRVVNNPMNTTVASLVLIADKLGVKEIPI